MNNSKHVVPSFFKPRETDIIDSNFTPPYRYLFESVVFTESEEEYLKSLRKELEMETIDYTFWTPDNLLRFIQGSGYNIKSTVINILKHDEWRKKDLSSLPSLLAENDELLVILLEKRCSVYLWKR